MSKVGIVEFEDVIEAVRGPAPSHPYVRARRALLQKASFWRGDNLFGRTDQNFVLDTRSWINNAEI